MTPIEQAKALAAYWRRESSLEASVSHAEKCRETADLLEKLVEELERP